MGFNSFRYYYYFFNPESAPDKNSEPTPDHKNVIGVYAYENVRPLTKLLDHVDPTNCL